jgi:hypothetical protein
LVKVTPGFKNQNFVRPDKGSAWDGKRAAEMRKMKILIRAAIEIKLPASG